MTASLIIIGSTRGGSGKTTVARLLLEMLHAREKGFRVFDGQFPNGSLKRFYPDAEIVDFSSTAGRMKVFDGISDVPTLIDLPAGLLIDTLQTFYNIGILSDAKRNAITLSVVHVLGPNVDSLQEAAEVAARLEEGGEHYLVKNCANDDRFEWSAGTHAWAFEKIAPKATIEIAHLDPTAREAVDAAGMGFAAFAFDESRSAFLRRIVAKWQVDSFGALSVAGFRGVGAAG